MKTMKYYTGISLLAALLLFSGCGKELDEFPAGGSGTESLENPEQAEGELLRLHVSDTGYLDAGTGSRATDSGLTTTFEDGDKIGLFVVNNENEVLYANVPYTKNGEEWTAEQNVRTKGYPVRVFAYYPYVEDAEIVEKINKEAQDASAFFKTYIDDFDISNQSTLELYRQADVMACMVTIENVEAARKELTLTMNHLMGLVMVKLPETVTLTSVTYYLKGDESYEWTAQNVTLPANLSDESFTVSGIQPLKEDTGCRYLCKSGGNNISFSGGFKTYGATKSYMVSDATVSAGSSKTYNVFVTPFAAEGNVEYTPQPGDFYMKDGSILPSVTSSNKANCIGIVYWVPTAADPLGSHSPAWLDEHSNCIHGLIIGLKEDITSWGGYSASLGTEGIPDAGFKGYSDTKKLSSSDADIADSYRTLLGREQTLPDGTSGWYIPSVDELVLFRYCYDIIQESFNKVGIGSLNPAWVYWSSAESGSYNAYDVALQTGVSYSRTRGNSTAVRVIAAF